MLADSTWLRESTTAIPCPPAQPSSPSGAAGASRWTPREVYPPSRTNACCAPRSSSRADEPSNRKHDTQMS